MVLLNSIPTSIIEYPSGMPYLTGFNREDGSEVSHVVQGTEVLITTSRVVREHSSTLSVAVRVDREHNLQLEVKHSDGFHLSGLTTDDNK